MEKKISKTREDKEKAVQEIKEKIQKAESVIIIKYSKLTVAEDMSLRREFRKAHVDYKVYKNTFIKRAFNELKVTDFDSMLNSTTSLAFGKDANTAARITIEQSKKYSDKIKAKCGYISKSFADEKTIAALASIPSKEVLLAKMLGSLKAPLSKLANLLSQVAKKTVNA